MRVVIASDHGGVDTREFIRDALNARGIEVEDLGCHDTTSVDYPDYANEAAFRILSKAVDQGILICTTGIGMSMAANKFPGIRAALCMSPGMAAKARSHNDANVLVLSGGLVSKEENVDILDEWLKSEFSHGERHERRIRKLSDNALDAAATARVHDLDPDIGDAIHEEEERQRSTLIMIASENYVSRSVRDAQASVMTNKYAEGYPGKRWYDGCDYVDKAERLAVDRAKELFGAEHVNVQPHCGSSANMAVYFSLLKPGETILAMRLSHGGHLTHGHEANFSGRLFNIVTYGVKRGAETIDYEEAAEVADRHKPGLIVAGASAYPRIIDFERLREIADAVGACLMVDIAHIAGLVVGGCHPSPVPYAEFVTSTTHKTLRGPRGGIILCRKQFAADIDKQVFPGIQGGPLMHTIAAKAVCFNEAMQPEFKAYAEQIVRNAKALAEGIQAGGLRLVSGGTDNHLMLVDVSSLGITGKDASSALKKAGIIANKNVIPFDTNSPFVTSGVRFGTPAVTTRGMGEAEMVLIADMILAVLRNVGDDGTIKRTRQRVEDLASQFPVGRHGG